jgi:hypothetical protein
MNFKLLHTTAGGAVESNNLSVNALGIYEMNRLESTANFVTQISLEPVPIGVNQN